MLFDEYESKGLSSPHTSEGLPVVPCSFDPYTQNIIAPDHCIAGITKNLLKVCFESVSKEQAGKLDRMLVLVTSKFGLTGQTTIFNSTTKTLNNLSMSALFSLITVLPQVIVAAGLKSSVGCFEAVRSFSKLVMLIYWWPNDRDVEVGDFDYVHKSDKYYEDLSSQVFQFIDDLQAMYTNHGANAAVVDTLNVHRLMELVINTIPTYGHALLIAELPFEAFHQKLKCNLSKNTTRRAHISAMKCVLFTDWLNRISRQMSSVVNNDDGARLTCADNAAELISIAKLMMPYGRFLFSDELNDNVFKDFQQLVMQHMEKEIIVL